MRKSLVFFSTFILIAAAQDAKLHPDFGLDAEGLAAKHGYPIEFHSITTEDGYIVGVHRIPHGRNQANSTGANRTPVLMMHGLMSCAADWINVGPGKSLAYLLADLGYDVWMGNARGTADSRSHTTLDPDVDKTAYWSFSFNEIGRYDVPAMIDYILAETSTQQLQYIGYSQGTTSFLITTSTRPEYNEKVSFVTLLAPAAVVGNMVHPLMKILAPIEETLYNLANMFGVREILPRSEFMMNVGKELCDDGKATQELCKIVLFMVGGYDREQLEGSFIPVITTNTPAGANFKQMVHFAQLFQSKEFRNFDYHDEALNLEEYGSVIPPNYDLSSVRVPAAIFYGENDWLSTPIDCEELAKILPNVVHTQLVDYKAFTHIDFIWAIDVVELLYNDVIANMEKYR